MLEDTLIRFRTVRDLLPVLRTAWRGFKHGRFRFQQPQSAVASPAASQISPLLEYFLGHSEGQGIWKSHHYFQAYERHFARFCGLEAHVLEIGVFSGGSLEMWRRYFGPKCMVYGVDIEPRCRAYENESVRVFIGDQSDRDFWRRFKQQVPVLDVVIDDGSHIAEHQIVALEELLPHLRPSGVYLCEDIHHAFNGFVAYLCGLAQNLNVAAFESNNADDKQRSVLKASPFQSVVSSVHLYPYMAVLERTPAPVSEFVTSKRGSQWEPFLK